MKIPNFNRKFILNAFVQKYLDQSLNSTNASEYENNSIEIVKAVIFKYSGLVGTDRYRAYIEQVNDPNKVELDFRRIN